MSDIVQTCMGIVGNDNHASPLSRHIHALPVAFAIYNLLILKLCLISQTCLLISSRRFCTRYQMITFEINRSPAELLAIMLPKIEAVRDAKRRLTLRQEVYILFFVAIFRTHCGCTHFEFRVLSKRRPLLRLPFSVVSIPQAFDGPYRSYFCHENF